MNRRRKRVDTIAEGLDVEVRNESGSRRLGKLCGAVWEDEVREVRRPESTGPAEWKVKEVSHYLRGTFVPQPGWDISSTVVLFTFVLDGQRYSGSALLQYRTKTSRLRVQGGIVGDEERYSAVFMNGGAGLF